MRKLGVIVGSTRPTRAADRVVPWIVERAQSHGSAAGKAKRERGLGRAQNDGPLT